MAAEDRISPIEDTGRLSLTDRIQDILIKAGWDKWKARRNAEAIAGGGQGVGGTGIGLADFTPAGGLFAVEEGGLQAGEGVAQANAGDASGGLLKAGLGTVAAAAGVPVVRVGRAPVNRAAEVARSRRRVGTTGHYVGAPPGVNSPQSLGALVTKYNDEMLAGVKGRNFYTDSSKDVFRRAGRNPDEADLVVQNLATLSRANQVGGNASMSTKGHIQARTGDRVHTGRFPAKDSPPLQEMYDAGVVEYAGHKRDPFAKQLSVEWAPERVGRGVNDMHEAEIMGYPSGKVGGPAQHSFMDETRDRAIAKANRTKLGGFSDWNTGNAQAAAWSGNKIRRGDIKPGEAAKSYADYFPLYEANATYEAVPGSNAGHLKGLLDAPYDARKAFTDNPWGKWSNVDDRDIGYVASGLLPGPTVEAAGRFRATSNPAKVARPMTAIETLPSGERALTEGSRNALDLVEGARAYWDAQDAGAWHKLMPSKAPDYTGAYIDIGRPMTKADMEAAAPLFEASGYYLGSAPNGLTVISNEKTATGADLAKEVRSIIKANKNIFGDAKAEFGKLEGAGQQGGRGYIDYSDKWPQGKGAATNRLLDLVDKAPTTAGLLEASDDYRLAVAARNVRDSQAKAAGMGPTRPDLELARSIFARDGWEGLRAAAKAGIVPAAALAVFAPGLFGAAEAQSEH